VTTIDYAHLADGLLPVVLAAGRAQLRHYTANVMVERKADASPVTIADKESEAIILDGLAKLLPEIGVIAEEEAAAGRYQSIGTTFVLVDPLDGTKEFISANGEFTINIAVVETGTPVFGLIYAPALGRLFVTRSRSAAVEAALDCESTVRQLADLELKPLAARTPPATGMVALVSKSHMNPATEAFLARHRVTGRRAIGSSLKFCLVAAGEGDVYPRVGPTHEWDTAAGHAIVLAAGGRVTALDGTPLRYGKARQSFRNPDYVAWGKAPTHNGQAA
jgi:3'(2'), 5'-bisphosphate nucleotidase